MPASFRCTPARELRDPRLTEVELRALLSDLVRRCPREGVYRFRALVLEHEASFCTLEDVLYERPDESGR
jgi:hypothetical protein